MHSVWLPNHKHVIKKNIFLNNVIKFFHFELKALRSRLVIEETTVRNITTSTEYYVDEIIFPYYFKYTPEETLVISIPDSNFLVKTTVQTITG